MRQRYLTFLCILLTLCAVPCLSQVHTIRSTPTPQAEGKVDEYLDELTEIASQDERSVTDLARGTYMAARLYTSKPSNVPYLLFRFNTANSAEEAMLSGLFVTVHGEDDHLEAIRSELEGGSNKQLWMQQRLGTIKKLGRSIDRGREWQGFMSVLPATSQCTKLAMLCMQSADPLVRRFGLYSGYWVSSSDYLTMVSTIADWDSDVITRQFARHLLKHPK